MYVLVRLVLVITYVVFSPNLFCTVTFTKGCLLLAFLRDRCFLMFMREISVGLCITVQGRTLHTHHVNERLSYGRSEGPIVLVDHPEKIPASANSGVCVQ